MIEGAGVGKDTIISVVDSDLGNVQHIETLRGISSDDLSLEGNGFDNSIIASSSDDNVSGRAGNDTLRGNNGEDTLVGRENDGLMIGGTSADSFVYPDDEGTDCIQDFDLDKGDRLGFVSIDGIDGINDLTFAGGAKTPIECVSEKLECGQY